MVKIKSIIKLLWSVHWFKTLYFNLHYLPLRSAIKIPILIFRNTKLSQINGEIRINCDLKIGLIKIGPYNVGTLDMKYNRTIWQNNGIVIFNGAANIGSGTRLSINKNATLTFGDKFCITGGSSIVCSKEISFGNDCLLSWDILIMDTDFHNIINTENQTINPHKAIKRGDRVWIGCRSIILKGVSICNDIVIAAGSKITKNINTAQCIIGNDNNPKIIKKDIHWAN